MSGNNMRAVEPITPVLPVESDRPEIALFKHLGALRYRDYRLFFISAFVSNIGGWIQVVAQGWLVLSLDSSPFWLGLVGFAGGLPSLFFSVVGGVFADRFDRRFLLVAAQTVQMLMALLLGVLTWIHRIDVPTVAAIAFGAGLAMALSGPAYQTLAKDLASDEVTSAIALNSTQFNLARAIGPSIAAVLLATAGSAVCFLVNAASFIVVIFALLRVKLPTKPAPSTISFRCSLVEAFRYVQQTLKVQWLLLLVAVTSIFAMPYITLLPLFAKDILKVGSGGLGLLTGAVGIGAVTGALLIAWLGERLGKGRITFFASLALGGSLVGFALSTDFVLSLLLLFMLGAAIVSQVTIVNTELQTSVPDQLLGRVMSLFSLAFMGLTPVGNLLSGFVANHFGAPLTLAVGAVVVTLYALQAFLRHRELLRL
ncbi:MFS transporter [Gloeobacter kilaueensis]|uniref:Major facilitator superfamily MFS_1 n=1 Tax=Gloeobacter kilaueensis (strain ATCC BAA-2537 / CCAP 1431/1 / ULC 316 / JS1) TaxID=1183438 RepID=U5QPG0_GLOK1|nr:MFS transporter [Gloeobacter kilaueensis]AGY59570.1 major facilitator superfamily MFS_1 [Gloeobacter kilaueensis JS1]